MTSDQAVVVGVAFQIEFFLLADDPHDQERFQRQRSVSFMGRKAFLPSPEDVIITKLRWCLYAKREKDRLDIRDVIAVQGNTIDWDYVDRWCSQHGTRDILAGIRRDLANPSQG